MLIDSNQIHKYLNDLEQQWGDSPSIVILLCRFRAHINDLEVLQAEKNAKHKYTESLEGLKDR